ncbi:MAG: N-acetyltransferase [Flavobacterium sp.]|nr:MAG: N-acetyltransferase [Flavobacterium sp.]
MRPQFFILETERLYLREMTSADAESLYQLNLDPEVIKFTGDAAFTSIEEAALFIDNYNHYKKYGFGRWAVIEKSTGEFLGWCGLKYSEDKKEFDIGFRFFKIYWNNGYATESARACVEIGFTKFGIPTIVGRAMTENSGSVKVLINIGLSYRNDFDFNGNAGVVYSIDAKSRT